MASNVDLGEVQAVALRHSGEWQCRLLRPRARPAASNCGSRPGCPTRRPVLPSLQIAAAICLRRSGPWTRSGSRRQAPICPVPISSAWSTMESCSSRSSVRATRACWPYRVLSARDRNGTAQPGAICGSGGARPDPVSGSAAVLRRLRHDWRGVARPTPHAHGHDVRAAG
jgi:hypothetical protein